MSATNLKKPPNPSANDRVYSNSPSSSAKNTPRPTASSNGVARTNSVRNGTNGVPISARAAAKKPATGPAKIATEGNGDDDARAEAALLIDELKARLQKAEETSEECQKQAEVLQLRLDDALKEQARLEEKLHEEEERIEGLDNDRRESVRLRQDLERIYEAERAAVIKDKEASLAREDELQGVIQRLKESLAEKDSLRPGAGEDGRLSRNSSSPSLEAGHFAPHSSLQRSNSKNNSKLLLQKDKVIESLRLELAEAQIKLMEMENLGGGRMQELERTLLETRMANARLMEDNESYQLLLSEKTLNGDLSRNDIFRSSSAMDNERTASRAGAELNASLADELSSVAEGEHMEMDDNERVRKLDAEVSMLKDQNKALTLYINKIIERILRYQGGFENILSNTDDLPGASGAIPAPPNKDKELPPPPKDGESPPAPSFLQRARSVVAGPNKLRPRPQSFMPAAAPQPSVTENPTTAPSIPLKRSEANPRMSLQLNRRSTSEWNAAAVVSNMYRGPANPDATTPASPGQASQRNSFFSYSGAGPVRTASGNSIPPSASNSNDENQQPQQQARKAALDALEGGASATTNIDTPSPPRSTTSREDRTIGGAIMTGSKMRPLRLVQEAADEEAAARKIANRSSWLPTGWFGGTQS